MKFSPVFALAFALVVSAQGPGQSSVTPPANPSGTGTFVSIPTFNPSSIASSIGSDISSAFSSASSAASSIASGASSALASVTRTLPLPSSPTSSGPSTSNAAAPTGVAKQGMVVGLGAGIIAAALL